MLFAMKWRQFCVVSLTAAFTLAGSAAFAQGSGNNGKPAETPKSAADTVKEGQKKIDEIAEATRTLTGAAGNPECVWLGRRVASLLWRDDLDTAFRHLDLYDRFGCTGGHVQAAFRCLTRFGAQIDSKIPDSLSSRVHACWVNPNAQPQGANVAQPAASPAPAAAAPAAPAANPPAGPPK
jgi:hypothetical protein